MYAITSRTNVTLPSPTLQHNIQYFNYQSLSYIATTFFQYDRGMRSKSQVPPPEIMAFILNSALLALCEVESGHWNMQIMELTVVMAVSHDVRTEIHVVDNHGKFQLLLLLFLVDHSMCETTLQAT